MKIIFSEGSGLNDSVYGNCQLPIRMFLERHGEQFEQQSVLPYLFLMGKSENFGDTMTGLTAMDGFEPVGENGAYPKAGMEEAYKKLLVYMTWKNSFSVSQEMVEDGKLLEMKKQPAAFMTAYLRTRELFGAALYGGALLGQKKAPFKGRQFDITAADGEALFSKNHVGKVSKKKQSNLFSDPFSADALGQMENAMQLFKGDKDEELDVAPDTILIPAIASLKKEVFAAIGADKDPDSSKNGFNYQFGRWNVIAWPYLNRFVKEGAKPWILLDSTYNKTYGGAVWNDRIPLTVRSTVDEGTDANVWRGRARFNATFNDFRFAAVGGMEGGDTLPD